MSLKIPFVPYIQPYSEMYVIEIAKQSGRNTIMNLKVPLITNSTTGGLFVPLIAHSHRTNHLYQPSIKLYNATVQSHGATRNTEKELRS